MRLKMMMMMMMMIRRRIIKIMISRTIMMQIIIRAIPVSTMTRLDNYNYGQSTVFMYISFSVNKSNKFPINIM